MPQNLRDLFIQGVVVILLKHVSLTYNNFVLFDRVNEEVIGVIFIFIIIISGFQVQCQLNASHSHASAVRLRLYILCFPSYIIKNELSLCFLSFLPLVVKRVSTCS